MTRNFNLCIALTFIIASESSFATTYKCDDHGAISYSDTPCKGKALEINKRALKSIEDKPASAPASTASRTEKALKVLEEARLKRETQREIQDLERDMDQLTQERNEQLEEIKKQLEYPEVDENDDDDELRVMDMKKSLTGKMSAISAQYEEKILRIRKQINELRGKK